MRHAGASAGLGLVVSDDERASGGGGFGVGVRPDSGESHEPAVSSLRPVPQRTPQPAADVGAPFVASAYSFDCRRAAMAPPYRNASQYDNIRPTYPATFANHPSCNVRKVETATPSPAKAPKAVSPSLLFMAIVSSLTLVHAAAGFCFCGQGCVSISIFRMEARRSGSMSGQSTRIKKFRCSAPSSRARSSVMTPLVSVLRRNSVLNRGGGP